MRIRVGDQYLKDGPSQQCPALEQRLRAFLQQIKESRQAGPVSNVYQLKGTY